jgi:CzcA family heavy metal efflux pump
MIDAVIGGIWRRRTLVWVAALGLAVSGAFVARRLPSGVYPEVEFPRIVVVARGGDAPPDVTQVELARPLETALATVLGVERIRSRTIRGAVELSLLFTPGTDMWRALQLVESRVGDARASLPAGVEVVVERLTTSAFPVLTFNLDGDIDPRRLRDLGELVLRPAISRVPGVGRVEVLGGDVREMEVILDPARAAALRLTPGRVADKIRAATVLEAVGRYDDAHQLVTVMASGEPRDAAELGALPVAAGAAGAPVPLSTVATVVEGAEDRLLRVSGPRGDTVLISISRLPGASTPDVVARVRAAVRDTAASFPAGVTVTPVYDQAALVDESMRSVRDAILIGIALCLVVIALFLRDLRGGIAAALAVPITLGMTFVPAYLLGQSLNLMSMGGLAVAIGLVIDDAIVVVEAIRRRLETGTQAGDAVHAAVRELLAALVGTTATTVVVFLPLAALEGLVGRFFAALAVTLTAAVLLSLLVAVTVVPLAAGRLMRPRAAASPGVTWYGRAYHRAAAPMLKRPWLGVAVAVAMLAVGFVATRFLETGFLPTMDEGAFVLDYFLPAGTSLNDTDAVARKIEAVLQSLPEVATYSRRTGAELGPATATEVSRGDIMVRLKPRGARGRSADGVIEAARERIARTIPEARVEFVQVLQDVLNDLSGTPRPIEIKLFGSDYGVLRAKAQEVASRIRDIPGLVDLYPGYESDATELKLRIDAGRAGRLGLTAVDLTNDLEAALRGVVASTIRRPDRPIGVRVRYPDEIRFDPAQIRTLPVLAGAAGLTTLGAVASAERATVPTALLRENLRPMVVVTADHEGRDLGSVASDVSARLRGLQLPEGYTREMGGQVRAQQQTFDDLTRVIGFGLLAVMVVLLAQFRRSRLALVVLASVPLALVGAVLTLAVGDVPLNASSAMGGVLLVGLVVKNGILLLEQAEVLRAGGADVEVALVEAGAIRVRPILMTTLATIAGLAPLALGLGAGAELQRPLAVAVIGGLVTSTGVSLLVIPSLVRLAEPRPRSTGTAAHG